jgi:release factor glutamine methyltransferase
LSESTLERPFTIKRVIESGTSRFAAAGLGSPRRDAERIVSDHLGGAPGRLGLDRERALDRDDWRRLLAAFSRRARGEPVPYVTGLAGFRNLTIRTDSRALIPRPETEGLVERTLAIGRTGVVADIGTGTGCVALSLRQEGSYRSVIGLDCSPAALGLARVNRDQLSLPIELVQGDFTAPLGTESVDLLVSNPPYVSASEYAELDPSVRDFEPRLALESGLGGLSATGRILRD